MTRKEELLAEERLLFEDLCGRIQYGVMLFFEDWNYDFDDSMGMVEKLFGINEKWLYTVDSSGKVDKHSIQEPLRITRFKPYLRRISDMTAEEYEDFCKAVATDNNNHHGCVVDGKPKIFTLGIRTMAWLNAHHFDYRGLIERKLALDVKETSNPYKEKEQ